MGIYSIRSKLFWTSLMDELYYRLHGKGLVSEESITPDVLIHIGTPKAGSSAIQHFCVSNRKKLFAHGFYYPSHTTDPNGVSGGHTIVSKTLLEGQTEKGKEIFNYYLRTSRAHGKTLFLSSEGFYRLREELRPILSGLNIRILAWFRNPVESFISNHNQSIKRNYSTAKLDDDCARFCNSKAKFYLDGRELMAWGDEYGDDVCIYMPYAQYSSEKVSIQGQLLNVLGIDPLVANEFKYGDSCINKSYSYDALELKRLLNSVLKVDENSVNVAVDRYLQRHSDYGFTPIDSGVQLAPKLLDCMSMRFDDSTNCLIDRFKMLEPIKNLSLKLAIQDDKSANLKELMQGFLKENPKAGRWIHSRVQECFQKDSGDEALASLASMLGFTSSTSVE